MKAAQNTFRIIGGAWRGRRLKFPPLATLRPSPDRVRETLFNWLQPMLPGARCLDLFAGSGALGMEALSRGAQRVVFVDHEAACCDSIRANCSMLDAAQRCQVVHDEAVAFIGRETSRFDIVFFDPPYQSGLLAKALALAVERELVAQSGRIYLETSAAEVPDAPDGWTLIRSKRAGNVGYHLLSRTEDGDHS